jgi:hypothetical protein
MVSKCHYNGSKLQIELYKYNIFPIVATSCHYEGRNGR